MSDFYYNGVQIQMVKLNAFGMEAVYSEDRAEYLYTRCVVDITGVLNPQATSYASGPIQVQGILPPATIVNIRQALNTPQGQLVWSSANPGNPGNPYIILESPAPGYLTDLNNGPRPLHCNIFQLSGSKTAMIRYAVETFIHECPNESNPPAILSNRFSQEHEVNDQFLTTITTTGTAIFRTDLLTLLQQSPDQFRPLVFGNIPVPAGFFRDHIHVQVSPGQNALRYTVTDVERMYDLGDTTGSLSFITKCDMRYDMVTMRPSGDDKGINGGNSLGNVQVRVLGDKRASNWVMTQRAFALALSKLSAIGNPAAGYIQQMNIGQTPTDRQVNVGILYVFAPANNGPFGQLAVDSLRIDNPFGFFNGLNPSPPWGKGTRGTYNEVMLTELIQTACSGPLQPELSGNDPNYGGAILDSSSVTVSVDPFDDLPSYGNSYSPKATENSQTRGSQEMRYRRRPQVYQAPIATPPSQSSTASTSQSDTPQTSFIQVANATSTLTVNFEVEGVGAIPIIPDPKVNDDNLVLLDQIVIPASPAVNVDGGTPIYGIIGQYVFGMKKPMDIDANLALGILGWTTFDWSDQQLVAADVYQHGLIDDPNGGSASGGNV